MAARRPSGRAAARTPSCRSRRTACSRSTSTCARRAGRRSSRTARRATRPTVSDVVPEGAAALIEVAEDRVVARAMSDRGARRRRRHRHVRQRAARAAGAAARRRSTAARACRRTTSSPSSRAATRRSALLDPRAARTSRWSSRSSCAGVPGTPGRGLVSRTRHQPRRERHGADPRGAGRPAATPARRTRRACGGARPRSSSARGANLSFAGQQDFGQQTLAHRQPPRDARTRTRSCAGRSRASARELHKSRIDNRLVGRGSSVNQVEIGFGGGRQLFDLTSYTRHIGAGHDRRPAQQGRLPRPRARLLQGHDRDPAHRQGHGQLPRRVRDAARPSRRAA